MNILIFGKGFIGSKLQKEFSCSVTERLINNLNDAEEEITKFQPDTIINCIGFTGKTNVDDCELEKDMALQANTFVPLILAEVALRRKIKFMHISSGCIYHYDYNRQKPITEEDIPDFFDLYYSRTKIYAERALAVLAKQYNVLVVRIRIPLDNKSHPKNVLDKLLKYGKVIDIPNSVTYVPDFIEMVKHLLKIDARGIFNTVNKDGLRYPELMEIYKKYRPDFNYTVIDYRNLGLVRTNLVMSVDKLEKTGFHVRMIQDVLDECVKEYVK
jgi:3,5-epimerase/4-reductase